MINFAFWKKHRFHTDEIMRFIVKNIQPLDVLVFDDISDWCGSIRDIDRNIQTQCGTGLPSDIDDEGRKSIIESIFPKANTFDVEELYKRKKIRTIALFGFDSFPPGMVTSIVCNFSTKAEILGVTDVRDDMFTSIIKRVKHLKNIGMNKDQTRLTMLLEDKYHNETIEQALMNCYTQENYNVKEVHVLDLCSPLWSNEIKEK